MEEPTIRRITVEREPDWLRVQGNIEKGLQNSLDARLATLPGGRDGPAAKGVKRELEERIKKIREEAFKMTKPNLRVNGHNYEDFVESTEPFDEVMDRNLKGLRAERLSAEAQVVEARRNLPGNINRASNYLEKLRTAGEWLPADEIPEDENKSGKEVPKPERYQETVDTFTTVAANLSELTQTAPAQLTRATRAHGVREEIANMGP